MIFQAITWVQQLPGKIIYYLQPESKKQSPVHFTVVSTCVDRFLQYLARVYGENMQH